MRFSHASGATLALALARFHYSAVGQDAAPIALRLVWSQRASLPWLRITSIGIWSLTRTPFPIRVAPSRARILRSHPSGATFQSAPKGRTF